MRILILSFYFSPDIGPGALRAKTLCDELNKNYKNLIKLDKNKSLIKPVYSS